LYYAMQCALATWFAHARGERLRALGFGLLTLLMVAATVLGLPAE
jgi:hypothetical protein